jgi:hypothetical protein
MANNKDRLTQSPRALRESTNDAERFSKGEVDDEGTYVRTRDHRRARASPGAPSRGARRALSSSSSPRTCGFVFSPERV